MWFLRNRITPGVIAIATTVTALLAGALPAGATPAGTADVAGHHPAARVSTGRLAGASTGGVDSFLGIPYAQPPTGDLRWRPPAPPTAWPGTRQATAYGNRCPATASTNGPRSETEDCLFLNVQRPAGTRPGRRLPVYVWIHGGGLLNGDGDQHDGSLIVRTTGVVVVTLNYRLGVFGFLAHPGLTAEAGASGNYGLMDQQAALAWVRHNIAAFGGDPRRVTIGGESAGGWSVCAHLAAPGSRGTFTGAIIQSGSCTSQTLDQAETTGALVAGAAGCPDPATAVACLRALPAGRLLDATPDQPIVFVRGVPTLPVDPGDAVRTGAFTKVPVLVGANRDEGRTFAQGFIGSTEAGYASWVHGNFGAMAQAVLDTYPWPADADQFTGGYLVGAIMTDSGAVGGIGGCATRTLTAALAASAPTFAYEFDHRTGPGLSPQPAGYVWGAGHAAELAYLWPSFDNGTPIAPTFTPDERRLALDMVRAWGSFVRTDDPVAAGPARWPGYLPGGRVMALRAGGASAVLGDAEFVAEHHCDLWTPTT